MVNLINRLIRFLAKSQIADAYVRGFRDCGAIAKDVKEKIDISKLEEYIGKKVILVSNEWENMVFGTAAAVQFVTAAQRPILAVKNCLTGETVLANGAIVLFSIEALEALSKLSPFERWGLLTKGSFIKETHKSNRGELIPTYHLPKMLKDAGFI